MLKQTNDFGDLKKEYLRGKDNPKRLGQNLFLLVWATQKSDKLSVETVCRAAIK